MYGDPIREQRHWGDWPPLDTERRIGHHARVGDEPGVPSRGSSGSLDEAVVGASLVIRPPQSQRIGGLASSALVALVGLSLLPEAFSDNPSGALALFGFLLSCAAYNALEP